MKIECNECKLWDIAAQEVGKRGMCEKCFNESCVAVNLSYQPERSKREDGIMYLKCGKCEKHHHIDDLYRCGALNSMET